MRSSRTGGEVPCSAFVRRRAGGRWSESPSGSDGGNRRAFKSGHIDHELTSLYSQPVDATGVSSARSAMGALAGATSGAATAAVGVVGGMRAANAYRGGRGGGPGRPLRGDRWRQAHHGAAAARPGQSGGSGVADEGSGGHRVGPLPALIGTRNRPGARLAAGRDGAAFRLQPGGVSTAVRSQREVGIAAAGVSGTVAGDHPAAGARGSDLGTGGDEVSGAGSPPKPGGLPAHGGHLRRASLRHARSGPTLCGLAARIGRDPPTDPGRSGVVFQNAASGPRASAAGRRRRANPRSGDGGCHCEPRASAAGRGGGRRAG